MTTPPPKPPPSPDTLPDAIVRTSNKQYQILLVETMMLKHLLSPPVTTQFLNIITQIVLLSCPFFSSSSSSLQHLPSSLHNIPTFYNYISLYHLLIPPPLLIISYYYIPLLTKSTRIPTPAPSSTKVEIQPLLLY